MSQSAGGREQGGKTGVAEEHSWTMKLLLLAGDYILGGNERADEEARKRGRVEQEGVLWSRKTRMREMERGVNFCWCTSERSRHYPGCLELGAFELVSVGFRDRVILCRRCILKQISSLGCSVDETRCPQRPALIRTSQTHKEVVSGSLSSRDAFRVPTERELLVVGVTQKTLAYQCWKLPDCLSVCFSVTLPLSDQC